MKEAKTLGAFFNQRTRGKRDVASETPTSISILDDVMARLRQGGDGKSLRGCTGGGNCVDRMPWFERD